MMDKNRRILYDYFRAAFGNTCISIRLMKISIEVLISTYRTVINSTQSLESLLFLSLWQKKPFRRNKLAARLNYN
jgi:hypothetical protein